MPRVSKPPKPIVIDRYKFKQDVVGYLPSGRFSHIYLFDVETRKTERLTTGKWDETLPSWSPDGKMIAFLSNHNQDPDRDAVSQIYLAEVKAGTTEKGEVNHSGGLILWNGSKMVQILSVRIDTSTTPAIVSGLVAYSDNYDKLDTGVVAGRLELAELAMPSSVTYPMRPLAFNNLIS